MQRNRQVVGVVAGLCLGMLVLVLAMAAARDGRIGWDVVSLLALAPPGLALLVGWLASSPSS